MNPKLNLFELTHKAAYPDSSKTQLQKAVARSILDTELKERFEYFLKTAKYFGYEKIYVGQYRDWPFAMGDMIFAEPKSTGDTPVLWNGMARILGGSNCGNGLETYDQIQLSITPNALKPFKGEYDLTTIEPEPDFIPDIEQFPDPLWSN